MTSPTAELEDALEFIESKFKERPHDFWDLKTICAGFVHSHSSCKKSVLEIKKEVTEVFLGQHLLLSIDFEKRVDAIYRTQISLQADHPMRKELKSNGEQIDKRGVLVEFHGFEYELGEIDEELIIKYLTDLSSNDLRTRSLNELVLGFTEYRKTETRPRNLANKTYIKSPINKNYLTERISQFLRKICVAFQMPIEIKIQILMMTGGPISGTLQNTVESQKLGTIIVDDDKRVVSYITSDGSIDLEKDYFLQQENFKPPSVSNHGVQCDGVLLNQVHDYLLSLKTLSENTTAPLTDDEIISFYESSPTTQRISDLTNKMKFLNNQILNFDEFPENSRIRMLFATQTPINEQIYERMKTVKKGPSGLILDTSGKIIKFESVDPNFSMKVQREAIFTSSVLNPVPWNESEMKEIFEFARDELLQPESKPSNLKDFCEKFKNKHPRSERSIDQLIDKVESYLIGNMDNLKYFHFEQKFLILFYLGIRIHPEVLKKLYEKYEFQINKEYQMVYCVLGKYKATAIGKPDENLPLSRPSDENLYTYLKTICSRTTKMTWDEVADGFLEDYPHFDSKEGVLNRFKSLSSMDLDGKLDPYTLISVLQLIPIKVEDEQQKKINKARARPSKRQTDVAPPAVVKPKRRVRQNKKNARVDEDVDQDPNYIDPMNPAIVAGDPEPGRQDDEISEGPNVVKNHNDAFANNPIIPIVVGGDPEAGGQENGDLNHVDTVHDHGDLARHDDHFEDDFDVPMDNGNRLDRQVQEEANGNIADDNSKKGGKIQNAQAEDNAQNFDDEVPDRTTPNYGEHIKESADGDQSRMEVDNAANLNERIAVQGNPVAIENAVGSVNETEVRGGEKNGIQQMEVEEMDLVQESNNSNKNDVFIGHDVLDDDDAHSQQENDRSPADENPEEAHNTPQLLRDVGPEESGLDYENELMRTIYVDDLNAIQADLESRDIAFKKLNKLGEHFSREDLRNITDQIKRKTERCAINQKISLKKIGKVFAYAVDILKNKSRIEPNKENSMHAGLVLHMFSWLADEFKLDVLSRHIVNYANELSDEERILTSMIHAALSNLMSEIEELPDIKETPQQTF